MHNVFTSLDQPFPGVVKPKKTSSSSSDWPLYSDIKMAKKIGAFSPGDSVQIDGWAPWLFHVTGKVSGFISFLSVTVPSESSYLIQLIEQESTRRIRKKEKSDSIKQTLWHGLIDLVESRKGGQKLMGDSDSIELLRAPLVFLRLSSSKKEVTVGECTVISFALYVDSQNTTPLQFPEDLGFRFSEIFKHHLQKENCWVASNNIINIEGVGERINNRNYTVYTIYRASYCPIDNQVLQFYPITLEFNTFKNENGFQPLDKKIPFSTRPLTIKVNPINGQFKPTASDFYKLVGNFRVTEAIDLDAISVGSPVSYSICLEGAGLQYPLSPPKLSNVNFTSSFVEHVHMDTIINLTYLSRTIFTYNITFNQSGEINLDQKIFSAFDPVSKDVYDLKTKSSFYVPNIVTTPGNKNSQSDVSEKNILEIDISQSMQIEDYEPNRLTFVKNALAEFLGSRKSCDIDLVLFSGEAFRYNVSKPDSCFAGSLVNGINFNLCKGVGTAMGDAIWYALHPLQWTPKSRKLIIIGDGESTSGITSLSTAIKLALARNVKIYTIGVGHTGPVKFGTHLNGTPNLVPQTFSDADLKRIAEQSGGKYFWAGSKTQLVNALNSILKQP